MVLMLYLVYKISVDRADALAVMNTPPAPPPGLPPGPTPMSEVERRDQLAAFLATTEFESTMLGFDAGTIAWSAKNIRN